MICPPWLINEFFPPLMLFPVDALIYCLKSSLGVTFPVKLYLEVSSGGLLHMLWKLESTHFYSRWAYFSWPSASVEGILSKAWFLVIVHMVFKKYFRILYVPSWLVQDLLSLEAACLSAAPITWWCAFL